MVEHEQAIIILGYAIVALATFLFVVRFCQWIPVRGWKRVAMAATLALVWPVWIAILVVLSRDI